MGAVAEILPAGTEDAVVFALLVAAALAYVPRPPGAVVEAKTAYLSADGAPWRAVVSKRLVGTGPYHTQYWQWYFSLYERAGSTYALRYRSPDRTPLDALEQTTDKTSWYPIQEAHIVGAAPFAGPSVQQLVLSSNQIGAGCGSARIDVFAYDPAAKRVVATLSMENNCTLEAHLIHDESGYGITLEGPYYANGAPGCCPTKDAARATVRFRNGRWRQTPEDTFEIMNRT